MDISRKLSLRKPIVVIMAKIIFDDIHETSEIPDNSPIADVCRDAGVPFNCTDGLCGTCVITILEGMDHLSEFNQAETDFLGEPDCQRLACQCKIKDGCIKVRL